MKSRIGILSIAFVIGILVTFAGCAQKEETPPSPPTTAGDPVAGKQVFDALNCVQCHTMAGVGEAPETETKGPELSDIGARQDKAYIRESIVDPAATVVEGYTEQMVIFGYNNPDVLSPQDLNNLVAYLVNQKG